MNRTTLCRVLAAIVAACTAPLAAQTGVSNNTAPPASAPAAPARQPMVLDRSPTRILAERIGRLIADASPIADPADAAARDAAGEQLAKCRDLINAADGRVLWGGFNPDQGYNPAAYQLTPKSPLEFFQLTELDPVVWAKLYLSTFMFTGKFEVREEEGVTVLDMEAKFRGDLAPGEYPYPFWHSPNKWTAYMNASRVYLLFDRGRLLAGLRKAPPPESLKLIRKKWDAKWSWVDEKGQPQPRVALFDYLFSKDNPHVASLEKSYRELEENFRSQNCMSCHAPDNQSKINDLLLLNYPNQSLVMRRTLVSVLEENYMPPGDKLAKSPEGVQDKHVLADLLRLAKEFEKHADDAFAYEKAHSGKD